MRLSNITQIVVALGLTAAMGCETIYLHNTVYQHDVDSSEEERYFVVLDTGLTVALESNYCLTGHFGDLKPFYTRPNLCEAYEGEGYCCKWTTESTEDYLCEEEWCYWQDTCDWDLNGWGEVCTLKDKENVK
jgi:hypothetical protein